MANIKISDGSALVSPQLIATTLNSGSENEQHVRLAGGISPADVTGSITTATSTVGGSTDYSSVGNITVSIKGTHAGVNATFEASDDAGTTWYPIAGAREDSGVAILSTGVLASNSSTSFAFSLYGFDRFRVRATAWTSGTANVVISVGALPFEPIVSSIQSNPPNAVAVSYNTAAAGVGQATTTEALNTMVSQRDLTTAGTATTFTVPVGKVFRILSVTSWARNGAATATMMQTNLRAIKTGTITATTGGIVVPLYMPLQNVIGATNRDNFTPSSSFLELQSGWSWGVSSVLGVASAATVVGCAVTGIEY